MRRMRCLRSDAHHRSNAIVITAASRPVQLSRRVRRLYLGIVCRPQGCVQARIESAKTCPVAPSVMPISVTWGPRLQARLAPVMALINARSCGQSAMSRAASFRAANSAPTCSVGMSETKPQTHHALLLAARQLMLDKSTTGRNDMGLAIHYPAHAHASERESRCQNCAKA